MYEVPKPDRKVVDGYVMVDDRAGIGLEMVNHGAKFTEC